MRSQNEITGDAIISKTTNQNYLDGYDRIFREVKERDNERRRNGDNIPSTAHSGLDADPPDSKAP